MLATVESLILIVVILKLFAETQTTILMTRVLPLATGTMEMKTSAEPMMMKTLWQEYTAVLVAVEPHRSVLVIMLVLNALKQSTIL